MAHGAREGPAFLESLNPRPALIALRNVNVHLSGRPALRDITWDLHEGEHWAFTGANGSGKSTLLRVIRGDQWIDPDGGERVYHFDRARAGTALSAGNHIGFVAPEQQEKYARLELPIDGRSVIASGLHDTLYVHRELSSGDEARVAAIVTRLGLEGIVRRRVRALSFGQLRRLLIARALVRRPRVLVLDEFTNGLDARARGEILELLATLASSVQMIFASHRPGDFIEAVQNHAVMDAGRLSRGGGRPVPSRPAPALAAAPANAGPPIVEIAGADVYRGATRVLTQLDWSIDAGEHTAVLGANGSGKSTFAALVAGTLAPAFGARVRRFGRPGPFDVFRIKETVVHVSEEWQVAYAVNHTVEEVILSGFASSVGLFHDPDDRQRERAAHLIGELGLAALRDRPFMQLSFGERRKVLVARSLVQPPALFVLDEVWNGLDAAFRARLEAQVHALAAGGTTMLLIAHHEEDLPALIVRRFRIEGGRLHALEPPPP